MKKRYEKFVLEQEKGKTTKSVNVASRRLIVKASHVYSKNYTCPVVPTGYSHCYGEWYDGFTIERCLDHSLFVWIPVGHLRSNGTLDGKLFNEKFGRRNWHGDEFSEREFHEPLTSEFMQQLRSVKKYGGFYISCYNISKKKKTIRSAYNRVPWKERKFDKVKEAAANMEITDTVTSHLTFGAEYDSVLEWFIESKARTFQEIVEDSTKWGNHANTKKNRFTLLNTGSCRSWVTNNIADFAGNVDEWTQEKNNSLYCVVRGAEYSNNGSAYPVAFRGYDKPDGIEEHGFRVALCIK